MSKLEEELRKHGILFDRAESRIRYHNLEQQILERDNYFM